MSKDKILDIEERIIGLYNKLADLKNLYQVKMSSTSQNSKNVEDIKQDLDFIATAINDIDGELKSLTPEDKGLYSVIKKVDEKVSFLEESLNNLVWRILAIGNNNGERNE